MQKQPNRPTVFVFAVFVLTELWFLRRLRIVGMSSSKEFGGGGRARVTSSETRPLVPVHFDTRLKCQNDANFLLFYVQYISLVRFFKPSWD